MSAKQYNTAGWLAVVLVPLNFIALVIIMGQEVVSYIKGTHETLAMGPGDIMVSILGLVSAYLLYVFRRLLRERYDFTAVDRLLLIAIGVDLVGSIVVMPLLYLVDFGVGALMAFFIPLIIGLGVLYIAIARRLLDAESRLNSMIAAYANVLLVNGVCYCSVIFSPLAGFFIEPLVLVILGMVFLREKEQVEFV